MLPLLSLIIMFPKWQAYFRIAHLESQKQPFFGLSSALAGSCPLIGNFVINQHNNDIYTTFHTNSNKCKHLSCRHWFQSSTSQNPFFDYLSCAPDPVPDTFITRHGYYGCTTITEYPALSSPPPFW